MRGSSSKIVTKRASEHFNRFVGRLVHRDWQSADLRKYIGSFRNTYLTYAHDEALRTFSASGATVSAILIHALEAGEIDGALVCRTVVENGRVRAHYFIARSRSDILTARGSLYVELKFVTDALPQIEEFEGRLAVVGLPCHIDILRRRMKRDLPFANKIKVLIALVCGHSSKAELIDNVTARLTRDEGCDLAAFHFRKGHWRGISTATLSDGRAVEFPFARFSLYQNLYFWSEKKCFQCTDHFAYNADISAGDIWSIELKNSPIKHTSIITRTDAGQAFFDSAVSSGRLQVAPVSAGDIMQGQARTAPFHYNLTARLFAARRGGLTLKDTVHEPVHWNHRLVAEMAMFNWRWSQSARWSKYIFKVPKPLMRAYLLMFKALESF